MHLWHLALLACCFICMCQPTHWHVWHLHVAYSSACPHVLCCSHLLHGMVVDSVAWHVHLTAHAVASQSACLHQSARTLQPLPTSMVMESACVGISSLRRRPPELVIMCTFSCILRR